MSEIVLIGLNHKTAPVELRECIAFTDDQTAAALVRLRNFPYVDEVLLFSTCNRVEILMVTTDAAEAIRSATQLLLHTGTAPPQEFEKALYVHRGDDAVRHVFRVASSLDSMMIGEPQILGQVKQAYRTAVDQRTSGVILNRLLHRTFFVAKRIRSETGIGDHAVSISYAAIELGRKIFGNLSGKKVLLIGAGEMAELAVEHLIRHRATDVRVANRTFSSAMELAARFCGWAIRFEEINEGLSEVDIIISSTGSPDFILKKNQLKGIMRKRRNRPLFLIDIAVPRDIDPEINQISNAYVYDIDDLSGVIEDNIEDRQREAVKGERIIDEAVIHFHRWLDSLDVVPTIKALRQKIEDIAEAEMQKTLGHIGVSDRDVCALRRMTQALINKILHDPTEVLKQNGCQGGRSNYLDVTRKLFRLDEAAADQKNTDSGSR